MLPDVDSDASTAAPRAIVGPRITARLPEILIQAFFLLVAVVLAFAVEEWREERELDGVAEEARHAILQEIIRNRDELLESRQETADAIAALESSLAAAAPSDSNALQELPFNLELALLPTAAWRTAQSIEASRRMDYTWMLQVSQTYELQAMYQEAQWAAIEALVTLKATGDESAQATTTRALLGQMRLLASIGKSLEEDYDRIL